MESQKGIPHILALDHGTSGCKVALVSVWGKVADFQFEPTPIHFLPGGGAEQDPEDWWQAFLNASKALLGRGSVPVRDIAAVAVSSTFSSTVAVDKNGNALMNSLTWMDSRGAPYIRKLMRGFLNVQGYGLTRILKWIRKTAGAPQLSGKDDISHVLYVKHELPEVYDKTYKFLGSKDYFNLRLTGQFVSSQDAMMLFWVTDTRDIHNIRYDEALISMVDIEKDKLPALKRSIDLAGTLRPEVARTLGLSEDTKVFVGSPDHQSALLGSGAVRDFEGHLYIGTSSWVECIVPFKKTDIFHSIASLPSAIPGKYQCINEQDIAGGCLTFLAENILFHRNAARTPAAIENPYESMDEIAALVPPGSRRLIFTPWLHGERTPVDSNTLRAGLYNLSLTSTLDDIIRAFYEGVAYNTRWSLAYVEKFVGRPFKELHMVGGGARSPLWCQIFADVMNRTMKQVEDPLQANARGAAFVASVGLGHIRFDDIPGLTRFSGVFHPDPGNRALYDELYAEFLNIYKNNKDMYGRLNQAMP